MKNSFTLQFTETAIGHIKKAKVYYKSINASLPKNFGQDVKRASRNIKTLPQGFRVRYDVYRAIKLARFPYLLYYKIKESTIVVVGVLHGRKDPEKIEQKLGRSE